MKNKRLSKQLLTVILSLTAVMLSAFSASAAGEIYTESDGVRTAYLSNSETITLPAGEQRNAYSTLSGALLALGEDGGKVYVCGEVTDNTEAKAFVDVTRTSPVVVTGLPDDGADDILNFACTLTMGGSFTFDNFCLNCTVSGGTYIMGGPGVKVFGENFTTGGTVYYKNYATGMNYDNAYTKTVFNTSAAFVQLCVGGDTKDLGTATASNPATAEVEVNNITLNASSIEMGYHNWNNNMYGNVNLTVNGGSFPKGKKIVMTKVLSVTGKTTLIFNNGMRSGFTLTYSPDYIVDSAVGGTVSIKTQAPFGGSPTFEFTPDEGLFPMIDGVLLAKNSDDEYLYTPEVSDASKTINVTWTDGTSGSAHLIGGEKTAFVQAEGSAVAYKDSSFSSFKTFTEAVNALGKSGGKVIFASDVTESSTAAFADISGRAHLEVTGLTGSEVFTFNNSLNFRGDTTLDNFTLYNNNTTDIWMNGYDGASITLGNGFKVNTNGKPVRFAILNQKDAVLGKDVTMQLSGGSFNYLVSVYTKIPAERTVTVILDGADITGSNNLSIAYESSQYGAYTTSGIFGRYNLIVNKETTNKKITAGNVSYVDPSSVYTVIFNNGIRSYSFNADAESIVDYRVYSAAGGETAIHTQGTATTAPTFILKPEQGKIPTVDGAVIPQSDDGCYYYTPELSSSQTTTEIGWWDGTTPVIYSENGERTAYLASTELVTLSDGTKRIPYATLSGALVALGENGGKVYICGEVTDNTEASAFVDVIRTSPVVVTGLPDDGADDILNFGYNLAMGGNFTLDNFCLNCTTSGAYIMGGPGIKIFGENFTTGGKVYYKNYGTGLNYDEAYAKTVFNTSAAFAQLCVGGDTKDLGTETAAAPATAEVEINNITLNASSIDMGYHNWNNNMYGNVNLIVNGGSFKNGKKIVMDKVLSVTGKTTAIFNNGTMSGFTFTYKPDYIVNSAVGGKTSIKTQAPFGGVPTFELVPDDGAIPAVNGEWLVADSNGKYSYTPASSETSQVITVTWEKTVYSENGKRCVYVKTDGGHITYGENEVRYTYTDINDAVKALGTEGGYIYVYGMVQFVNGASTAENVFVDTEGRAPLYIYGIDGTSAQINYYSSLELAGDLTVDKLTYHRLDGTLWDTGFYTNGYNLTLGENFVTTSDFANQVMTIHGATRTTTFEGISTINIHGGTVTRITPGSTYFGVTVTGDTVVNLYGGTFGTLFGGSHGGASSDSIYNGDVTYNIYGGTISNIYTGVNTKTGVNGNVTVNIDGGIFDGSKLYHGNASNKETNYLSGNSVYVIKDGSFNGTAFGDGNSRGVTGEEIFIVNKEISGYTYKGSSKGTFIKYDTKGTVTPVFDNDGTFAGYRIICEDSTLGIIVDGVEYEKNNDNIYTIPQGEHTVEFLEQRTVSFNLNGAQGTAPESIGAYGGTTVTLEMPDAYYYRHRFIGWNTDKNAENGFLTYTVPDSDVTLYAIWAEIKPELTENSGIENSGITHIKVTSIPSDRYESHSSVIAASDYIKTDALTLNGGNVIYAFSVRAYDENSVSVSDYDGGLCFRIPKAVLMEKSGMQFYRLYKVNTSEDVSLMSENISVLPFTEDESYLYFKDYSAGNYTVVLANEYSARYIYKGSYNQASGKYTVDLYFDDADACYGTFGIKYDTDVFTLESFTFADDVTEYGNISVADGGFSTYYNRDGIYQNTWNTKVGIFAAGEKKAVKIGTFTFAVSDGFEGVTENSFVCADFKDSGIQLDFSVLETVWQNGSYLYAPMVASTEVFCQATEFVFEETLQQNAVVSAKFVLVRDITNSPCIDEETNFDSSAVIAIISSNQTVFTASENELALSENENGKAVIEFSAEVSSGTYSIIFIKNGYVKYMQEFTVDGTDVSLGEITPLCGDIKADYADECGDGTVDIDDFIRVLRGFATDATKELRQTVDINEDGTVSVQDIAYIKTNFGK